MEVNALKNQARDIPVFPEFKHLRRFWMPQHQRLAVKVVAGDFYVGAQDELISTVLGSCVSACIRDPQNGVGGINHFLLPDSDNGILSSSNRYGVFAMEQLLNALIKYGGCRQNFEIKLVGGGNMMGGRNDIGGSNITFVKNFLATEGLSISAEDLGGDQPRKILYNPLTGKLLVNKLRCQDSDRYLAAELKSQRSKHNEYESDDVELFD